MNIDEVARIESDFNIRFPSFYRSSITTNYPFKRNMDELQKCAEMLIKDNTWFHENPQCDFPWISSYWIIGTCPSEGVYFIDTNVADETVYHWVAEDVQNEFKDLYTSTFKEFIDEVMGYEDGNKLSF